jgi:hypothetical protein
MIDGPHTVGSTHMLQHSVSKQKVAFEWTGDGWRPPNLQISHYNKPVSGMGMTFFGWEYVSPCESIQKEILEEIL